MHPTSLRQLALIGAFISTALLSSCKRDPEVAPSTTIPSTTVTNGAVTDKEVNDWILENMKYYYLWTDKLPANPDKTLTPDKFFLSLLYDRANTANSDRDRFSWIQASATELKAALSGETKTTGMHFRLYYRDQSQTSIVGVVQYVLPGSPAAQAGVKRGDVFTRVNSEILTGSNYNSLLYSNADTYAFTFAKSTGSGLVEDGSSKTVQARVFQEDPVLLDSVYVRGSKTIGYVVYNQFVPGPNGSSAREYDVKLDNIFAKFKAKGVNELVLDLRYNPGGYVSSSVNLASLIGKNVAGKVFYKQQWNPKVSADNDQKYGAGKWDTQTFTTKGQNIGANLNKVYILTTSSTASASELIINGLKPFMDVVTIGTTTVGKNVGSITISDANNRIKWGMQPLTFKSANASGFADYAGGFVPSTVVAEPTYSLKPFGDTQEALLSEAFYAITGTRTARRATVTEAQPFPSLGSSVDRKAGGGNMFVELPQ